MSAGADSLKSILFALGANFLIALAKTAARSSPGRRRCSPRRSTRTPTAPTRGCCSGACARARRRPSPDHPLGYGKAIYFWSFIVALMLFSMGGLFSIYEGVHKLQATEPVENAWVAIGDPGVRHRRRERLALGCLREVNKDRGEQGLWRWFRTSRQSELLVVLAEDIAALGGLVLALAFIALASSPATRCGTRPARSASACCSSWSRCWSASRSRRS